MNAVNLDEKFAKVPAPWLPRIVGELNGQYVKVVKFEKEFVWHSHDHEDEIFQVADRECHVLLFEPNTTLNTGDVRNERTQEHLEWP